MKPGQYFSKEYFSNIKQHLIYMIDKVTDKPLEIGATLHSGSRNCNMDRGEYAVLKKMFKYILDRIKRKNPQLSKKELSDIALQLSQKVTQSQSFEGRYSAIDRFEYNP